MGRCCNTHEKAQHSRAFLPKVGVEPTLPKGNYALNVARLPVPPLRPAQKSSAKLAFASTATQAIVLSISSRSISASV